jgi:hypothetical protein
MPNLSFLTISSCGARRVMGGIAFSAMLGWGSTSFGQTVRDDATVESGDAKSRFAMAQKLFKADRFAEALPIFRDLTETTHSPNARLYVAHCLQQLGKNVEAYKAFAAVVKETTDHPDAKYGPTREAAIAQLAVLNVRLARVVISVTDVPSGAAVTLDGAVVEEKELGSSIVVEPGTHRVDVSASGIEPMVREVSLEGGELKTVTLSLKKGEETTAASASASHFALAAPDDRRSDGGRTTRTIGFVVGGAGVAGLATFTITGLMAKSTFDDLEAACPKGCNDAAHMDQIDRGKKLQTTANIGLVFGLLGVAGGVTLFVLGQPTHSDASVSVTPSYAGSVVSYTRRF